MEPKQHIIDRVDDLKNWTVTAQLSVVFMQKSNWARNLASLNLPAGTTVDTGRTGGPKVTLDLHRAVAASVDSDFNTFLNTAVLSAAVINLHDLIRKHDLVDSSALMEFLRHVRNGVAHGNHFLITSGRIDPAVLRRSPSNGGDLEITKQLDGKQVILGFLQLGDVIDLLDAVGSHLTERDLAGLESVI